MSAPSPVLDVIDDRIAQALARSGWRKGLRKDQPEPIGITEFRDARAAVAELIEAHEQLLAIAKATAIYVSVEGGDEEWANHQEAVNRAESALARVKGVQS